VRLKDQTVGVHFEFFLPLPQPFIAEFHGRILSKRSHPTVESQKAIPTFRTSSDSVKRARPAPWAIAASSSISPTTSPTRNPQPSADA